MKIRTATNIGIMALSSQTLLVQGCGSNNPSTTNTGGTPAAAGATTPTAGTTAAASATATTPTGGAISAAGATTPPVAPPPPPAPPPPLPEPPPQPVAPLPLPGPLPARPPVAPQARPALPGLCLSSPCVPRSSRLRVQRPPRVESARTRTPSFATRRADPRAAASSRRPAQGAPTPSNRGVVSRRATIPATRSRQPSMPVAPPPAIRSL